MLGWSCGQTGVKYRFYAHEIIMKQTALPQCWQELRQHLSQLSVCVSAVGGSFLFFEPLKLCGPGHIVMTTNGVFPPMRVECKE